MDPADQTARIRRHFDELGEGEWERLDADPRNRAAFEVHRRFLADFVAPGWRVLEIGAGPGRFTIALARLGARVVVTDISEVQLELNTRHVAAAGTEAEGAVEDRFLLDVRDTARFADGEFDTVLAFGGPLSYVFDDAGRALAGLLRIGRVVAASVMSTLGAWSIFLPQVVAIEDEIGAGAAAAIFETGDLRHEARDEGHTCRMYRSREVRSLVHDAGGELLALSTSNWASLTHEETLAELASEPAKWDKFMDQEVSACREPGLLDAGTHITSCSQRADAGRGRGSGRQ